MATFVKLSDKDGPLLANVERIEFVGLASGQDIAVPAGHTILRLAGDEEPFAVAETFAEVEQLLRDAGVDVLP